MHVCGAIYGGLIYIIVINIISDNNQRFGVFWKEGSLTNTHNPQFLLAIIATPLDRAHY